MVIFEMLDMVFILIYFLCPYEILGMAGQVREEREGRLCTNYANIFRRRTGTSRVKQGQAGTSREYRRMSRANSDKQDTILSTHYSCHGTVDLIYTMENGYVLMKVKERLPADYLETR